MQIIHKLTLDTAKQGVQAAIPVTVSDSGSHLLMISFCTNGIPVTIEPGMVATFYALKPDGTEVVNSCVCYSQEGAYANTVLHTVSAGTLAVPGQVNARIIVGDGESTYFSPRFILRVEENEFLDSELTSTSEYSQLIALASSSNDMALNAEAWAVGTKGGIAVAEGEAQYQNNARYYARQFTENIDTAIRTDSSNPVANRVIKAYVDSSIAYAVSSSITNTLNKAV